MPHQLRNLFCTICIFSNPTDPQALFEKYKNYLIEDLMLKNDADTSINLCMIALDQFFKAHSKSTDTFNLLPKPNYNIINIEEEIESNFNELKKGNELRAKLNNEQENIVKNIIESVEDNTQKNKAFFIDGPGGTGKTFVYNTITHLMKGKNKKVISVAWTGIASILLIDGRTVHNAFQIPLELNEDSRSSMTLQSNKAIDLKNTDIIIWDEAAMAPIHALIAVDKLLKEIMNNNLLFGGKTFVMGGDFRQIPPVVNKGNKLKIIENSIKMFINNNFIKLKLTINMRANENDFKKWLLEIGNGIAKTFNKIGEDLIQIPEKCIIKNDLIDDLYNGVRNGTEKIVDICCLSTKNEFVDQLNLDIQSRIIPGFIKKKIR